MENVFTSPSGKKIQLGSDGKVREVIAIDELLSERLQHYLFVKASTEEYALLFQDTVFDFHKAPLYSRALSLQLRGDADKKQPAAYFLVAKPSGIFYIGSTGHLLRRLYSHRTLFSTKRHYARKLTDELEAHGEFCLHVIALYQNTKKEALELEQALLDHFDQDPRLVNYGRNAAKPALGTKRSAELVLTTKKALERFWSDPANRENMSLLKKEFFSDPSNREHMSKKTREYFENNPDAKQKHTERMLARFSTEESRAAQSEKIASAWQDPEKRQRFEVGFKKRATPINVQGHVYAGYTQASKALGLDPSLIRHRVLSKLDTWKEWVFADADGNPIQKETISHEEMLTRANEKRVATFNQPEYRKQLSRQRLETFSNPAVIEKMRAAREGQAKPVRIDGVVYASIAQAARQLNVSEAKVNFRVSSPSERFKTWQFV